MNIKWEKIKSEDQLKADTLKSISVEKEGSDIVAVYLEFEDGRDIKISKTSEYSKNLNVFVKAPDLIEKEVTYVMARKEDIITETKVKDFVQENRVRNEFESLGYETWIRKETVEAKIDAFSDKEAEMEVPF